MSKKNIEYNKKDYKLYNDVVSDEDPVPEYTTHDSLNFKNKYIIEDMSQTIFDEINIYKNSAFLPIFDKSYFTQQYVKNFLKSIK
jgi:hypothetical protein